MVMGDLKRFKRQLVCCPEVAPTYFIKCFHCAIIKGAVNGTGDAAPVLNVLIDFLAGEESERGAVSNAMGNISNLWVVQPLL